MTDDLILFHREILRWIEDGCPEHASFMDRMGLCLNAEVWLYDRMSEQPEAWKKSREFRQALINQFVIAGLHDTYPFNEFVPPAGNEDDALAARAFREYLHEVKYRNPRRLKWIRDVAARPLRGERA
ncbi:TPA: hypothetical protein ACP7Q5_004810 [Escherichia coli]|jgi:hypothetical protein|nr:MULTISPECIES: hypothetical protein [Bacilli]ELG7158461.1 hypothetical protein [Staphylococcus aureus]HDH7443217.1 hypothetical protein [Escherichia coli]ELL1201571.1 hypothetical protein [Staphylococcus aureus]MDH9287373.1 hypothetical protein [Staphylococcus epidermidis]MDN3040699.1 hypothetical protein [Enterococcus faecium]